MPKNQKSGSRVCLLFDLQKSRKMGRKISCRPKNAAQSTTLLWISHWISTGRDVQNRPACAQLKFCSRLILCRYNVCAATLKFAKLLIAIGFCHLSTKKASFTITTNFVYILLYKTVNSKKNGDNWTFAGVDGVSSVSKASTRPKTGHRPR